MRDIESWLRRFKGYRILDATIFTDAGKIAAMIDPQIKPQEVTESADRLHRPPDTGQPMEVFPRLADPQGYRCNTWNILEDAAQFAYWIDLFRHHIRSMRTHAMEDAADRGQDVAEVGGRFDQVITQFDAYIDALVEQPARSDRPGRPGRPDGFGIMEICLARESILRANGFADPYRLAKSRANEQALPLLPALLNELDELDQRDPEALTRRIIRGVFAGNIFDLGATKTNEMFTTGGVDFHETLARLKDRPWLIDDLDAWVDRALRGSVHRCAAVFVDNAGCDIVLGMIPLVRWLIGRGTRVIVTANTFPSLNDVTIEELRELIDHVGQIDGVIANAVKAGTLMLVPSGNGAPLIDLTHVSGELAAAVREHEVDLVILEGMGRGVETNLNATLTCDTLKLAMVKDEGVAEAMGGTLYDLVMRYEAASL